MAFSYLRVNEPNKSSRCFGISPNIRPKDGSTVLYMLHLIAEMNQLQGLEKETGDESSTR
jgi:hypothetical protein